MPLWQIHHHSDAFTEDQKKDLSRDITALYENIGLPKFYVIVIFSSNEDVFIGGVRDKNFVRIVMTHLAREAAPDEQSARKSQRAFNKVLKPYIEDRGLTWEYNYDHSPRKFWQINGLIPPAEGSEEETWWRENNQSR